MLSLFAVSKYYITTTWVLEEKSGKIALPALESEHFNLPTDSTAIQAEESRPGRKAAMSNNSQHVVPHDGGWAVRGAGNSRVTSTHQTQNEAISVARNIARHQRTEVVIHRPDGKIRDKDSYGNDPMPPRDRKN